MSINEYFYDFMVNLSLSLSIYVYIYTLISNDIAVLQVGLGSKTIQPFTKGLCLHALRCRARLP